MQKAKILLMVLLCSVILFLFAGCKLQNATITTDPYASTQPTNPTQPNDESTQPNDESTEPTEESTEPSSEVTGPMPTETVCPRTIDAFKSYLTPYITYGEVRVMFGKKDREVGNNLDLQVARWVLNDGYIVQVLFYPPEDQTFEEYLSKIPDDASDEIFDYYYSKWFRQMEAYKAAVSKKGEDSIILFDVGYPEYLCDYLEQPEE